MYIISTGEQFILLFTSHSEEVGWHRERGGNMSEEYGRGRWGVNFYSLSFGCFCAILDCFLKITS